MSLTLDISGFEALFVVNYQSLCTASYRIVQDKDIAEDIVQDVFYKLWEKREETVIHTSLKSYLFQNVINQSLNYLKRYRTAFSSETEQADEGLINSVLSGQSGGVKGVRRRVDEAIRSLPEVCRMTFILSRFHKMSFPEIAEKLEIPSKTVESQLKNALTHLSKFLLY